MNEEARTKFAEILYDQWVKHLVKEGIFSKEELKKFKIVMVEDEFVQNN